MTNTKISISSQPAALPTSVAKVTLQSVGIAGAGLYFNKV